ncbi:MAG: hypothetical protein EOQ39_17015 [Mesorhizobium sp.]|nr:hypothetical protein EN749_19245 [Mesorhizobium sp. M7A.F.Ca.ET.027.02.1.1]RWB07140.1 MAG: hypothetical protein EOQ37_10490 [Mesorhizobium sp.]RWB14037.1 MAG: hypothetical protein EOQ39_17015 [Mesorhizobium sp.]RWD03949.1 MAG: hypothetical protein EOS73_21135 [Mesorhizobium sp.]
MMSPEVETSQALVARLADLQAKARAARINEAEIKTFQKLAAVTDDSAVIRLGIWPFQVR